jgi:NTE family protein
VRDIDGKAGRIRNEEDYKSFQSETEAQAALYHPTNLRSVTAGEFECIARNGFEVADAVLTAYCPKEFPDCMLWLEAGLNR